MDRLDPDMASISLKPHHTTLFEYPAVFGDDEEFEVMEDAFPKMKPFRLVRRFNPMEPIVNDDLVRENKRKYKEDSTSFWFLSAATEPNLELNDALRKDKSLNEWITVGQPGACWMWIHRDTTHRQISHGAMLAVSSSQLYKFPLRDLFDNQGSRSQVVRMLYHLVNGISDRAFRHSHTIVERTEYDVPSRSVYPWKSHASHQQWLTNKHIRRLEPKFVRNNDACAICKVALANIDFDDIDWSDIVSDGVDVVHVPRHEPVKTPCGHIFGRACLLKECKSMDDPRKFQCPVCQRQILSARQVKAVVFGLDCHDVYQYDEHFTKYENFERSCADLDAYRERDMEERITLNRPVLIEAWYIIRNGARLEEPSSTPLHLQAAHSADLMSLVVPFEEFDCSKLDSLNGHLASITQRLSRILVLDGLHEFRPFLTSDEIKKVENHFVFDKTDLNYDDDDLALIVGRRPYFRQFFTMILTRCLRFQQSFLLEQLLCLSRQGCLTSAHGEFVADGERILATHSRSMLPMRCFQHETTFLACAKSEQCGIGGDSLFGLENFDLSLASRSPRTVDILRAWTIETNLAVQCAVVGWMSVSE
nr:hypothetical protein CFP56_42233 [Quercus suber]